MLWSVFPRTLILNHSQGSTKVMLGDLPVGKLVRGVATFCFELTVGLAGYERNVGLRMVDEVFLSLQYRIE